MIKLYYYLSVLVDYLLLSWLTQVVPILKLRRQFEEKNPSLKSLPACSTWLHVSSEGELEQAMSVLEHHFAHSLGSCLLLITSPSVEKKALKLQSLWPDLHIVRLPLVTRRAWFKNDLLALAKPKNFFMVRYDFFPVLLKMACDPTVHSTLLNGTLKGKHKSAWSQYWHESLYACFDTIYWASPLEIDRLEDHGISLYEDKKRVGDFRHERVLKRQKDQNNLHALHDKNSFEELLLRYPFDKRIIFGSVWNLEISHLLDTLKRLLSSGHFIFLAPHHLKGEDIEQIKKQLSASGLEYHVWSGEHEFKPCALILCELPGLLCELYPHFAHAYVGGGFGRSVHSLIEAYWAGAQVYCGPKVHRSTEYDFILSYSPDMIHLLQDPQGLTRLDDVIKLKKHKKASVHERARQDLEKGCQVRDSFA